MRRTGLKVAHRAMWFSVCLFLGAVTFSFGQATPQGTTAVNADPVFRAMGDELNRSIAELKLNDLDKPYFIQYIVLDEEEYTASATFGSLTASSRNRQRYVHAQVRLGSYDFDSSEFSAGGLQGAPTGILNTTTIDDNYAALRHSLWLSTDDAYKQAVETLSRKRAFVQNKNQGEQIPDFSKEAPTQAITTKRTLQFNQAQIEKQLRDWSMLFRSFPSVQSSSVSVRARMNHRYIANSEGTRTLQPELVVTLTINATTQSADGMTISHAIPFNALTFEELPTAQTVADTVRQMGSDLTALQTAPVLDANYSGPVLLAAPAAAEMFSRVLAPELSGQRGPMTDRAGQAQTQSALADRVNRPVLPTNISVVDDPSERNYGDRGLIGQYSIDDQGVPAHRVSLIEGGLLTDLLMSRRPAKDRLQSNGHGRNGYPGRETAQISNLIITATDGKSYDDLKQELIQSCKAERLQYCIAIKSLNPNGGGPLGTPILTYKVYVDSGREELVRGATVPGGALTVQALRHLLGTGNDPYVLNRLSGTRGAETPVSIVAPSVLLEEIELNRPAGAQQKPATLTHPFFSSN